MMTRGLLLIAAVFVIAACGDGDGDGTDATNTSSGDTTDTSNGSGVTQCMLGYTQTNASGKGFGAACTDDAECEFGECMLPGDTGNITNDVFGFCTRGCDCESAAAAQLPDELKETLDCLYPSDGGGGLRDYHHVVVECTSVATCTAIAAEWNACRLPDTGGARKVCHADAP